MDKKLKLNFTEDSENDSVNLNDEDDEIEEIENINDDDDDDDDQDDDQDDEEENEIKEQEGGDTDDDNVQDDDDDDDNEEETDGTVNHEDKKSQIKENTEDGGSLNDDIINDDTINDDDDEDEDDDDDIYLFDDNIENNIIENVHTMLKVNNMNDIRARSIITRDEKRRITDDLHKTIPILTKYEKAKILGIRAHQINSGCKVFVERNENEIDSYLLAERELYEKKMPFIIKRPLPSGNNEYWYVNDLELIH